MPRNPTGTFGFSHRNDIVVFRPIFFFFPSYTWQGRCGALAACKCSSPRVFFAGSDLLGKLHKSPRSHTTLPWVLSCPRDIAVFDFRPRRRRWAPPRGSVAHILAIPTVIRGYPLTSGAPAPPATELWGVEPDLAVATAGPVWRSGAPPPSHGPPEKNHRRQVGLWPRQGGHTPADYGAPHCPHQPPEKNRRREVGPWPRPGYPALRLGVGEGRPAPLEHGGLCRGAGVIGTGPGHRNHIPPGYVQGTDQIIYQMVFSR